MKKITKLQDFYNSNKGLLLNENDSKLVHGGIARAEETNDYCHSYIDTCDNNCSDIHVTRERDGNVFFDETSYTYMSDCTP